MRTLLLSLLSILVLNLHIYSNAIPYPGPSSTVTESRPRLKSFHFDSNIIDGQTIRVFCQLLDGSQPLSFQWLKDGQPLHYSSTTSSSTSSLLSLSSSLSNNNNNIEIQTFHDYSSLAIYRVDHRRDSGNYTCLASNSYGSDQHSSMLIVQEPPSFLEKPHDISIGLKQSTFVMCRASPGHIKPVIKWNRILFGPTSGTGLPLEKDSEREQISSGEQFHLTDIRIEDAGLYECVVENPHNGLAISHQFTITVNVPAYFKTKTDQIEVKRGETAKLICESFGAKPISVVWLRQNIITGEFEPLNLDYIPESFSFPRYTAIEKNFDSHFDESVSTNNMDLMKTLPYVNNNRTLFELHINAVNSIDNGQYGCRARNDFGEDLRRINLFVQDVPAIVREIQLNQIWTNEVSITWLSPETIGNSPITQYIVQYWKETRLPNSTIISSGYRLHEIEVSPTTTLCLIKNLSPGTSYAARVIAVNQFGRGPSSSLLRFQTEEENPAASPIDIIAEAQGTSSLRIRWKAPPKSHWNGRLKGYYLGYRLISGSINENSNEEQQINDINNLSKHVYAYKQIEFNGLPENNYQEEFLLTGLNRASLYGIILKCFNHVGESPNSHEVYASTAAKDPPPKPTLIMVEAKETSVLLKWDQKASSDISHYIVFYKEEKKSNWMEIEVTKSSLVNDESDPLFYNYKLGGLHRGTLYQMYIRSVGDKSSMSEPSETINVRTEGELSLVSMLNPNMEPQQPYHVAAIPTVLSPNAHQPTLATFQQQVPPYFRLGFIIPIAIAVVVIVIACVGAYVYIRIDDRNNQMKMYNAASNAYIGTLAVGPGKRFQYISPGKTALNTSSTPSFNSSGIRDNSCTQSLVSEESSLSFRYSDSSSDKGRPLLARPPIPTGVVWAQQQSPIPEEDEAIVDIDSSAYETLPFQKNPQSSTPLQSFIGQQTNGSNHSQNSFTAKSPPFPPPPPPLPGAMTKVPLNHKQPQQQHNIFCHVDVHHAQSSGTSDANNSDSYDEFHFFSPARV